MNHKHADKFHPAANIFPLMNDSELASLAKDIKDNEQQVEIWYLDGKILDGRNRWLACQIAGVDPREAELDPEQCKDPVAMVLSLNEKRRHLDESQRGMVAAKVKDYYTAQALMRKQSGKGADGSGGRGRKKNHMENLPDGLSTARDAAGSVLGVSGKTVDHCTAILQHGSAELIEAVERGEVAASKAAKIAKATPKKEQMAEAKKPRKKRTPKPKADAPQPPAPRTGKIIPVPDYDDEPEPIETIHSYYSEFLGLWNRADEAARARIRIFIMEET